MQQLRARKQNRFEKSLQRKPKQKTAQENQQRLEELRKKVNRGDLTGGNAENRLIERAKNQALPQDPKEYRKLQESKYADRKMNKNLRAAVANQRRNVAAKNKDFDLVKLLDETPLAPEKDLVSSMFKSVDQVQSAQKSLRDPAAKNSIVRKTPKRRRK